MHEANTTKHMLLCHDKTEKENLTMAVEHQKTVGTRACPKF